MKYTNLYYIIRPNNNNMHIVNTTFEVLLLLFFLFLKIKRINIDLSGTIGGQGPILSLTLVLKGVSCDLESYEILR